MNNTRENIVNISFTLFVQKSYKEVTIKEIVEKAGVSQGAFFHYFKSKEQLFKEIVDNSFSSILGNFYSRLSKDSLYLFYHDYINIFLDGIFVKSVIDEGEEFGINYFSLIFEALKIFPDLQEKLSQSQQMELDSWKEIISIARNKGEIKSVIEDEQIANIFIYSSDGIGMRCVLKKSSSEFMKSVLLSTWDSFYCSLKV